MAERVIIDCDPGVDDAMAIFLAAAADDRKCTKQKVHKIHIEGLTIVMGNNPDVDVLARWGLVVKLFLNLSLSHLLHLSCARDMHGTCR